MRRWGAVAVGGALGLVLIVACSGTDETAAPPIATAAPAERCSEPTAADCIRAVYRGGPGDYAQVAEIPPERLLRAGASGRYRVERGQQVTVVTAAPLPEGYTQFSLERSSGGTPLPVSYERPVASGATYTFTPTTDDAGPHVITYELRATRPHPRPQPGRTLERGQVVVRMEFVIPTLRYDTLDATGRAAAPGSYAILTRAGDAASAIGDSELDGFRVVELRIHPADASGTSRASLYDTVTVGDSFDYRMRDIRCAYRLRVTSVGPAAGPRTFGVEHVSHYGRECPSFHLLPGAAGQVEFEWGVPPGAPGADGLRVILHSEAAGEGTYRVHKYYPWVIDVPPGIRVSTPPDTRIIRDFLSGPSGSFLILEDVETGAELTITTLAGAEAARYGTTPAVDDVFDQIAASVRYRELPPDGTASVFAPASEWTWTITCDGERNPIWSRTESSKALAINTIWLNQQLACAGSSSYTLSPVP